MNLAATEVPGMIESIDQVNPDLDLRAFSDGRILEQRQVHVIHGLPSYVREPERERANVSPSRLDCRGRDEFGHIEPAANVVYLETFAFIECLLTLRNSNVTAQEDCICCKVQWRTDLPGVNSRHLPAAEKAGGNRIVGVSESLALPEWKFIDPTNR